jgi:hypothetical protein
MDAVCEPGGVDRVQETRFEQGLRPIELEARADCEAEEITHLGLTGHEVTKAFEYLAVGGFHRIGILPKPSLKKTAQLGELTRRTGFHEQELILTDNAQQGCDGGSHLDLCELAEMVDGRECGAPEEIRNDGRDALAMVLVPRPSTAAAGRGLGFWHFRQGAAYLSRVEEKKEVDQAPMVIVHEDILEGCRDGLVVALALRHHPLLVIPVAGLWSSPAFHLRGDQGVKVPSQLENPVGQQKWVTPGHDLLFVAAENREGGGERCCERRE